MTTEFAIVAKVVSRYWPIGVMILTYQVHTTSAVT